MKTEEIYTLLGVPPATLFDWNKPGHKKEPLAKLLKAISLQEAKTLIEKERIKQPKPMMLLSTVNGSIGDPSKHFTLTKLKTLFYKKEPLNAYEKYALKVIKQEAMPSEIEAFVNYYKIAPKRVERLLSA
ncbi:MAG: hypothetical protein JXK05_00555 [Campylobacterales bacterium]|nr:hypothetical protein [Campylobacterales bacterium]